MGIRGVIQQVVVADVGLEGAVGFVGASSVERLPVETALSATTADLTIEAMQAARECQVGVIALTGVGGRFSSLVLAIAGESKIMALLFTMIVVTILGFRAVPGGYIPFQDKQYLFAILQLPEAATIDRTDVVLRRMGQIAMDTEGVAVSSGAACTAGALEPSHVLQAMGVEAAALGGADHFGATQLPMPKVRRFTKVPSTFIA